MFNIPIFACYFSVMSLRHGTFESSFSNQVDHKHGNGRICLYEILQYLLFEYFNMHFLSYKACETRSLFYNKNSIKNTFFFLQKSDIEFLVAE